MSNLNMVIFDDFSKIEEKYSMQNNWWKLRKHRASDTERIKRRRVERQQTKSMKFRRKS